MNSKTKKILVVTAVVIVALGGAFVAGRSGGGPININQKIEKTDQTQSASPVQANTQATLPNGGLRGMGKPPAPEPEPEPVASTSLESENGQATTSASEGG